MQRLKVTENNNKKGHKRYRTVIEEENVNKLLKTGEL